VITRLEREEELRRLRLHHLTFSDFREWIQARKEEGQKRYGDAHLQRYGLVDVAEELQDSLIEMELVLDRLKKQGIKVQPELREMIVAFSGLVGMALSALLAIDKDLPDEVCTDERGGDRIWWGRKIRNEEGV